MKVTKFKVIRVVAEYAHTEKAAWEKRLKEMTAGKQYQTISSGPLIRDLKTVPGMFKTIVDIKKG